jgi:chemotaxis protein MotA
MDIATIIGFVLAVGVLLGTTGGKVLPYLSMHAGIVVVGGLIAATFIKFSIRDVANTAAILSKIIKVNHERPQDLIAEITSMANVARKDGILALEKVKTSNQFLQMAINHCVDGMDPDTLQTILYKDTEYLEERHHVGIIMFESMGEAAPALGMVGTLFGMVDMLGNMSDPSSVGPAMAVALLATTYGAVVANLFTIPIGIKLHHYSKEEQTMRKIVIDGIVGIQKGVNPRVLETMLMAALSRKERDAMT